MARFYVSRDAIKNGRVDIIGKDVNHIKNVLRMKQNDGLVLSDGDGFLYEGVIEEVKEDRIRVSVHHGIPDPNEPAVNVTIYQCVPKGDKMALVIQKSVELGVAAIIPVVSTRCVSRPEKTKSKRWQAIAEEAAKQCGRGQIPAVSEPVDFLHAVANADGDLKLLCYELEENRSLHDVAFNKNSVKKIDILIGPEGGFEKDEAESACRAGFIPVTLGKRILRTETVAPVVTGIVMYIMGDM